MEGLSSEVRTKLQIRDIVCPSCGQPTWSYIRGIDGWTFDRLSGGWTSDRLVWSHSATGDPDYRVGTCWTSRVTLDYVLAIQKIRDEGGERFLLAAHP